MSQRVSCTNSPVKVSITATVDPNVSRKMAVFDTLPYDVRAAIRDCPFLVDITKWPHGISGQKVASKIRNIKTYGDAVELDSYLLSAGLRHPR